MTDLMDMIDSHVAVINACNQRGGRMLSLIDLLEAGTVDLRLAAYLAAAMRGGASLLVGAKPGGAGKTAVMCSLLNFVPDATGLVVVDGRKMLATAAANSDVGRTCYLAHEIGPAQIYSYLWGADVRAFIGLAARGHLIASNLHADTVDEVRHQLCGINGVDVQHFNAIHLLVFIRVVEEKGVTVRREIAAVYERDSGGHRAVWRGGSGQFGRLAPSMLVKPEAEERMASVISSLYEKDIRAIREVRVQCCDAKW